MKLKIKNIFLISFLAVASVFGAFSAVIATEKANDTPVMEKAEANSTYPDNWHITYDWDNKNWNRTSIVQCVGGYSGDIQLDTTHSYEAHVSNYECKSGDEFYGHTYRWQSGYGNEWELWDKVCVNNATGSIWSGSGTYSSQNVVCSTDGVYHLTYKPQDRKSDYYDTDWAGTIYISWGTVTVTLHYMDSVSGSQIQETTETTTSQNAYFPAGYDDISGYDRNSAVWKTTASKSGTNYSSTRLTTLTKDLYVYYTPAQTITRHALFFKDGSFVGTAQLANEYVINGGSYAYDTSSDWPNGYDYQPAGQSKETYSFEGVYSSGNTSTGAHSGSLTGSTTISSDTTIYEVFTRLSTYTITYNRNNGPGSATATQNKTYGISYSIANPTAFSWSPSDMKYFKYWNTEPDDSDSGTKYYIGDSYGTNAALGPLYYIEDYWEFQVKCGSGSYSAMAWNTGGGLPDGVKGQFGITMNVTSGESLTFQVNKHDGSGWQTLSPAFSGDDNNYADGAILADTANASIYLKIKDDNSYDVYVSGYSPCAIVVGSAHYPTTKTGEGDDAVYDTEVVNISKGQTVVVSWNHIDIDTYLNGDSTSGCFTSSEGTVTCVLTGAYNIRVHNNGIDGKHNTVYITRDDTASATYLASIFNGEVGETCNPAGGTDQEELKDAWDSAAAHFTGQPTAIKNLFVKNSSDSEILEMMGTTALDGKYQYVIHKYGTGVASDFLGTGTTKAAYRGFGLGNIFGSDDNNVTTIIIVVASSVALLSVTALSILVIKKRKNKEQE